MPTFGQKRGPKPKPIALHKLHGTYNPSKHGPEEHPMDDFDGFPEMPRDLPAAAKKFWRSIVPQLVRRSCAVEIDTTQLAAMCRFWAHYQTLIKRMEKQSPFDDESDLAQWRLEKRARAMWQAFDSIASRFGLTPADRMRLRVAPPAGNAPANPLDVFGIRN